ncbi:MAG: hypothetical protein WBW71_03035, partial [Bacteroidota bacterium]
VISTHFQRSRKCFAKCRFIVDDKDGFHSTSPVIELLKVIKASEKINKVLAPLKEQFAFVRILINKKIPETSSASGIVLTTKEDLSYLSNNIFFTAL